MPPLGAAQLTAVSPRPNKIGRRDARRKSRTLGPNLVSFYGSEWGGIASPIFESYCFYLHHLRWASGPVMSGTYGGFGHYECTDRCRTDWLTTKEALLCFPSVPSLMYEPYFNTYYRLVKFKDDKMQDTQILPLGESFEKNSHRYHPGFFFPAL